METYTRGQSTGTNWDAVHNDRCKKMKPFCFSDSVKFVSHSSSYRASYEGGYYGCLRS